jgi:hypothetical protein
MQAPLSRALQPLIEVLEAQRAGLADVEDEKGLIDFFEALTVALGPVVQQPDVEECGAQDLLMEGLARLGWNTIENLPASGPNVRTDVPQFEEVDGFFESSVNNLRAKMPMQQSPPINPLDGAEFLIPATCVIYRDGVAENQIEVCSCCPPPPDTHDSPGWVALCLSNGYPCQNRS